MPGSWTHHGNMKVCMSTMNTQQPHTKLHRPFSYLLKHIVFGNRLIMHIVTYKCQCIQMQKLHSFWRSMTISGERESSSFQAPHLREEHPKGKARKWFGRVRCQWKVPIQFKFPSLTISRFKIIQSPDTLNASNARFLFFVRVNLTSNCTLLNEEAR